MNKSITKQLIKKMLRYTAWTHRVSLLAMLIIGLLVSPALTERNAPVVVLEVTGIISGAVKNYVARGIKYAEDRDAPCVIITIDTPGGLMDSMKDIATEMINADIPVVVYVYPNGSTATSAGFFILMAADFAAMAPDTSTGSAHPVAGGGQKMDKVMKEKTTNYAIKYMEQLVQRRGRNGDIARDAVFKSISVTSQEALQKNVIEIIATSIDDLLEQLDGREFVKGERTSYTVYLDDIDENLKSELESRGLLQDIEPDSKLPESVTLYPEDLEKDVLDILLEKGIAENSEEEIVVAPVELDADVLSLLEERGHVSRSGKESVLEIAKDEMDEELKELLQVRDEEGTKFVLNTKGAEYEVIKWSLREKFFQTIGHPNIAYILLMVGVYAIIFEVTHPGTIVPGAIGAICLLIAFTSFQVLPINTLGLILIIAAVLMFILEVKIVSHGLLTIGGIVSMTIGSLLLVDSADPALRISIPLIIAFVGFTAVLFLVIIAAVVKSHNRQVSTGAEGMTGKSGRVVAALDPEGKVFSNGEIWNALSSDGSTIDKDTRVTVDKIDENILVVRRKT